MTPTWLDEFEHARAGRSRGFVMTGNTADKVFWPESTLPPLTLKFFLAAHLARAGYHVGTYSLAGGFEELPAPASLGAKPQGSAPFSSLRDGLPPDQVVRQMVGWLRTRESKVALVIDYADHLVPTSGSGGALGALHLAIVEMLHSAAVDENVRSTDNLVVLVSHEGQVSSLLLKSGMVFKEISIALPDSTTRSAFIARSRQATDGAGDRYHDGFVRATGGLPLVEIEDLMSQSAGNGWAALSEETRLRKASVIGQMCHGLLEIHEPDGGFELVAGLDHAKEALTGVVRACRQNPDAAPQALLLAGVPGCGKSFLVKALAHELGFPCLSMRSVRESLVGAAERNLERVLWVIETLAPCLVWVDEIDQIMGKRTTGQSLDAGVSERMMARIWEFMGGNRHRGRVLWVGTSNRPDILDSALLDRFQVVIPFLHPTREEVAALLPTLAGQVGRRLAEDVRAGVIAGLPTLEMPTVRGLQEVVARASTLADLDAGKAGVAIGHDVLEEAAADYQANYDPVQHELVALNAIRMTSFSSLLPWRTRKGLRSDYAVPAYLQPLIDQDGRLDPGALDRRLQQLALVLGRRQ